MAILPETLRGNVDEALRLAASPEERARYAARVPIADVVAEVFCGWEDTYLTRDKAWGVAFDSAERSALAEFDRVCDALAGSTRSDLETFERSPAARRLGEAAASALAALGERRDAARGRALRVDPSAASASPDLPAFVARPDGAPAYHGFVVVPETFTDGWAYGAITAFDVGGPHTEGDGFVVAPDGSRAGIVWATDTGELYEILPPDEARWGVYGVRFPRPVANVEDLVECFRAVLPRLREVHARLHGER